MHNFRVDTDKCISCGLCVRECLFNLLQLQDGHPVLSYPDKCIGCLHCFAICPAAAISMDNHTAANAIALKPLPDKTAMEDLIRQRRSIRFYKQENGNAEQIRKILELAWDAPSGGNQHLLKITVIDDMAVMDQFRTELYSRLAAMAGRDDLSVSAKWLLGILGSDTARWKEEDKVLRHAPHLVVSSYAENALTGLPDSFIYLTYFEALAITFGLGTLWCGYLDLCLRLLPELAHWLGIAPNYQIGYPMLFGIPAVKYQRSFDRSPAKIYVIASKK